MKIFSAVGVAVSVGDAKAWSAASSVGRPACADPRCLSRSQNYLQKHPSPFSSRQQVAVRLFGLGAVLSIIHAALETLVCVPVYFGQGLSGAETVRILLGLVLLGSFGIDDPCSC